MRQRKQAKINKYVICENTTIIYYDYRVGDKVVTINNSAYNYETLFKGPYENFQMCTNGTVTLRMVVVTTKINIRNIKPYNNIDVE